MTIHPGRRPARVAATVGAAAGMISLGMIAATLTVPVATAAAPTDPAARRQAAFAAAAHDSGVPEGVLLAVSYTETRWEAHGGKPSVSGAYGPLALTDVPASAVTARGDGVRRPAHDPALHTVTAAARLTHVSASRLKADPAANIAGGAALLASYERDLAGTLPDEAGGWYGAVARYSGSTTSDGARQFADAVYRTLRSGATARTADGQRVALPARPNTEPATGQLSRLGLRDEKDAGPRPECPRRLDCDFIPAAYQRNDPDDPGSYGNYDVADRPHDMKIDTIVLHDTEETYADTVGIFTNPASYVSAHYLVRSGDGHVTQFVRTKDVAWQAGNWYVNAHSIGIEQEGFAIKGASWFTEPLYHSTARLVRYLARRFHIRLDRQHIIGHDNVPGITPDYVAGMHWDPGPFWNWAHFMALVGHPVRPTGSSRSPVVTINPRFSTNVQQVTDCEQGTHVPAQASSFVWLRTAPSPDAPLYNDKGLHPKGTAGTTCAADWGDKASAGQQFVVAGRHGDWTAIWWEGDKVWFHNRHGDAVTHSSALVVRPRHGRKSVPVYGRAYPEASAYPSDIPVQPVVPLQYTIQAGQSYVYGGRVRADYYYAKTIDDSLPHDHTDVVGHTRYLRIQLGHRIAFVQAGDVVVRPALG